uniref:VWFA domain-containing protein n=1 Tax=Strongyloides venezuelensis TaxID=75913 RepID=A0A0K0G4U0_STRVS
MAPPSKKSMLIAGVATIILLIGVALIVVAVVELTKNSKNSGSGGSSSGNPTTTTIQTTTIINNPSNNGSLGTLTTTTISTLPPIICDMAFVVDSSFDKISLYEFMTQIEIMKNNVSTLITNFRNIYLTSYDKYQGHEYNFYSMDTIDDFKRNLDTFSQGKGSRLSLVLNKIATLNPPFCGKLSTYVFISEYNLNEIQKSISLVNKLKEKGSINFVILGSNINAQELSPLNPSNILTYDFISCDINEILNFIKTTQTCGLLDSTICSSTTPSVPIITTTQQLKLDCNVAIGVDLSSDILTPNYFNTQIQILQNNISNIIPDFGNVALVGYNQYVTIEENFDTLKSKNDYVMALDSFKQQSGFNLTSALESLNNLNVPKCGKLSTYVFLSQNITNVWSSIPLAVELKSKGTLNFIILGTAIKQEILKPLNPSKIYTFDLAECDIDGLIKFFTNQMMCSKNDCSITTTPSPCIQKKECNVIIATDSSTDVLMPSFFENQVHLLQYNITKIIPDFKRTTLFDYNENAYLDRYYGTMEIQDDFINAMSNISQQPGSRLSTLLQKINMLESPNNYKVSTFVFISKYDQNEIEKSSYYAYSINSKGSLNFIILGTDIKETELNSLTYSNLTTYDLSTCDIEPIVNFFSDSLTCSETCIPAPCDPNQELCNIMFSIDTSSDVLNFSEFNQLIGYLENNISSIITDYSHVGISSYNENVDINNPIGSLNNVIDFVSNLNSLRQNPGWRLSVILNYLVDKIAFQTNTRLNTFVFITKFDENEIELSYNAVNYLKSIGTLNFVLVGTEAQTDKFLPLSPTSIYHLDFANCNITELVNYFKDSLNCNLDCDSNTVFPLTTTEGQHGICDLYISFALDTFNEALSDYDFQYTKTIIQNNISSIINNFSKVSLFSFDENQKNFPFLNIHNVKEFYMDIYYLKQSGTSNLSKIMHFLDSQEINGGKLSTFIFIAHKNIDEIVLSINYATSLKNKGSLTFVIIGTGINKNDLQLLNYTNVIYWNFKSCSIDELVNELKNSLVC